MKRYERHADTIAQLIHSGALRPGDRVPSVREASRTRGISPSTVFEAYYLLEAQGLIHARPRSGYYVSARQPTAGQRPAEPLPSQPAHTSTGVAISDLVFEVLGLARDRDLVPLGSAFPGLELFPLDRLARCLASGMRKLDPWNIVQSLPPGDERLRQQIALRYGLHGSAVDVEEIIITNGAMEALNLCLEAVTQPGDVVVVESPTFYAALQALERLNLQALEIATHPRDGIDLAALAEAELPALKPYRPQQLVREFARSLRRELDLAGECRQAERIATNMAALPHIVIPRVHWTYTRERINVQDFIDGTPGGALAALTSEAGFDRTVLAQRGAQAVLQMIVKDGVFHADPHPGNVFYLPGNRIAFIDFGMVGRLSQRRRDELLQLLLGLVEHQPQAVADVLLDWTGDAQGLNLGQLETEIEAFVDQYHGVPLAQLSLGQMLADVTAILREHHLGLPSDLALLIKAFISLEGMGRNLDPDFHMASEALPLLKQVVRERYEPKVLAGRAWSTLRRALATVEQLPDDLGRLLRNARRGHLQVGIELAHLKRVGDQIDRSANRLAMALVIAALIIGSSIVMTVKGGPTLFGLPAFGFLGFFGAVVCGLWLVRAIWRSSHHRDDD